MQANNSGEDRGNQANDNETNEKYAKWSAPDVELEKCLTKPFYKSSISEVALFSTVHCKGAVEEEAEEEGHAS